MTPQQKAAVFRDPVLFQQHILGRTLWERQKEIIRSVVKNPLTCAKGCHSSGKTWSAAGLVLWWLARFPQGKVFTTGPTGRQVKIFWKDIAAARMESRVCMQLLPEPNATGLNISPDRYALGASSSAGVNIQGFKGRDVLIICDEAPGIVDDVWDGIQGLRMGGHVRLLELGNPVVSSGHFYDSFHRDRGIYNPLSISAFDTPNLQRPDGSGPFTIEELLAMNEDELAINPYRGLITRAAVVERYKTWGPSHPKYLARVLAQFPKADPYSVFPLEWLERAKREPSEKELRLTERFTKVQVGIDVAGAGSDETVLTVRIGGIILEQHFWLDPDPRGAVLAILRRLSQGRVVWTFGGEPPEWFSRIHITGIVVVVIDIIGIGYNFALHVGDAGFPVFGFQAGGRAIDPTQFVNQKAEAHMAVNGYMKDNEVSNLVDEETAAQMSTIRWRETSRGLTEIESKEDRNKRGIPGSPDRAESVIMSFLKIRPAQVSRVYSPDDYSISAI